MTLAVRTYTHTYQGRGACRELIGRRDPEVLISGPAGTGKSRACLEKMNAAALKYPGMRGLMLRKTQVSFTSSGAVTWKRDVIPELTQAGAVSFYGGSATEPAQYRYSNGSVVVLGGMDKASKIMSTEYDLIYVQEATELTEDDWEALTTRLRSGVMPYQQLMADCNPAEEFHWLKVRTDIGQTTILHSRHEDNPLLFDEDHTITPEGADYIAKLDNLTGPRYRRLRLGEWSSAEGVVYENFDSAVHIIDPFEIPAEWPRYWSIDFGFTNPFVCQWWAEDPDGRLFLYREWYKTKTLVEDHARKILAIVRPDPDGPWLEPKPKAIICDHDAEGQATLRKHLGLSTTPAKKDVIDGIQAVAQRLQVAPDGKARLFMLRDALERGSGPDESLRDAKRPTWSGEEIQSYVWDQRPDKPPKEEPVKEDDHGMDAMRYMVVHRDIVGAGKTRVRWL